MPDERGERTEAPDPRRRQEAREKGQVARSQDLPAAVLLLGCVVALHALGPHILNTLLQTYATLLGSDAARPQEVIQLLPMVMKSIAMATLPILLLGVLFVTVANLAQVGWILSTDPLMPDVNRLNPVNGLMKLMDLQALVRLGMGAAKMALVAAVAAGTLWQMRHGILYSAHLGVGALLGYSGEIIYTLCLRLAVALLVLAIIDYAWQRWQHEQDLKMSKEEVKEEFRRMEGDPMIKHRRRQVQQQTGPATNEVRCTEGGRRDHEPDGVGHRHPLRRRDDVGPQGGSQGAGVHGGDDPSDRRRARGADHRAEAPGPGIVQNRRNRRRNSARILQSYCGSPCICV